MEDITSLRVHHLSIRCSYHGISRIALDLERASAGVDECSVRPLLPFLHHNNIFALSLLQDFIGPEGRHSIYRPLLAPCNHRDEPIWDAISKHAHAITERVPNASPLI